MTYPPAPNQSSLYRIWIRGRLKEDWSDWFDGMTIEFVLGSDEKPITTLTGVIIDQSALYGVLNKVRDLGLTLLAVERIDPDQEGGFVYGSS